MKPNFSSIRSWFRLTALLLPFLSFYTALAAGDDLGRPNLRGTVRDESGQPLAGATVFIYTAGPKKGTGVLCPSCYADCRKRATSDDQGRFLIESLDPDLLFRVLVVGKDRQPEFIPKVDPAEKALVVTLKTKQGGDTPDQRLQGRVIDPDGKPVSGAVINIRGVTRARGTQFGGNTNIDPVAVSDSSGAFVINGREPFEAAGVDVEARGFAKGIFQSLATGDKIHSLKLTEGVAVRGRVVKDGEPLAGVEIGLSGADRSSEVYIGDFSVATDANGQFLLANMPPQQDCFLYGLMQSLGDRGAIPARRVRTQGDGSTLAMGDLQVQPGFTVAGQIRLTTGNPLSTNVHVMLSREEAWDTLRTVADSSGKFRFTGVPAESVDIYARVQGHQLSLRNQSLDPNNPYRLMGRVKTNKSDLVMEFEPGTQRERVAGSSQAIREEPLRGAEVLKTPSGDIKVTGTVVDAETKEPLPAFTISEGRQASYGQEIEWMSTRKSEHKDGAFTVYLSHQRLPPALMVEAEGYLPKSSGLINTNGTNVAFEMKKGTGPSGVVLKPDGQPAGKVTVYLTDMKNGVYVADTNLSVRDSVYRGTKSTRTDTQGQFSFPAQIDAFAVVVIDEAGYAERLVEALDTNPKLQLQPYGRVEGKLLIGSQPGAKESIRLGLAHIPYAYHPRHFPPISLFMTTITDDAGHFVFERVPPIPVEVYHEPKVRDGKMGTIPQSQTTKFDLRAGETRQLVLGGKGRLVTGKVEVSGYDGEINFRADVHSLESVPPPHPALPDMVAMSKEFSTRFRALTNEVEKTAAQEDFRKQHAAALEKTRAFYQTEPGRRYHFAKSRHALNFSKDGSFRIQDVPGGKYNLKVELREGSGDSPSRFSSPVIASLTKEIEVPDSPGARSDEPFDLGALPVESRTVVRTGAMAPDFAAKTLDDKSIKLADYKGKYLLLDFWAVWCGPCVAETPFLKAAWDAFKDDPRFAMVGLSLDSEMSAPRSYAKKAELGWTQGFLGEWDGTKVPERFGVEGIPAIFLLDPNGKIIAKDLRGDAIKAAIQAALKK
jgi:peroxiredoxin